MDEYEIPGPSPLFIAHHEAGHAVAALALGVRIVSASIAAEGRSCGRVITAPTPSELQALGRGDDAAVIAFAGPTSSDCRHSGREPANFFGGGSTDDLLHARALGIDHAGNQARAQQIVDEHGAAIDRIVGALLERGTLSGDEVERLFRG